MKMNKDVSDAVSSQETPKTASKSPEATGEAWDRFFFTAFRRNQHCIQLNLRILVSRTETIHFCCLSCLICGA